MEKKTALMLVAIALPSIVLPVPGGPKSRMPLGGARAPCGACAGGGKEVGGGRAGHAGRPACASTALPPPSGCTPCSMARRSHRE